MHCQIWDRHRRSVLPGNFSLSLIYIIRSVLLFKFEALSYGSSGSVLPGNFSLSTFIIECLAVQIWSVVIWEQRICFARQRHNWPKAPAAAHQAQDMHTIKNTKTKYHTPTLLFQLLLFTFFNFCFQLFPTFFLQLFWQLFSSNFV